MSGDVYTQEIRKESKRRGGGKCEGRKGECSTCTAEGII